MQLNGIEGDQEDRDAAIFEIERKDNDVGEASPQTADMNL
jgi:hypothetical protein